MDKEENKEWRNDNKFYFTWKGIKNRCFNKNDKSYKYYGGKGIKCEWASLEDFARDMFDSYKDHLKEYGHRNTTIERINSNKNYCKKNCKWATWVEQNTHKESAKRITYKGKTKTFTEWAKTTGIKKETLWARIYIMNWDIKRALTEEVQIRTY
jgi:hypothetical protein